ncbi:MAG: metallophosphoesterase family protein [Thermodesulfobacteriota bacterium]
MSNNISWVVFGDLHSNPGPADKIPEIREAEGICISGDLTNLGRSRDAERMLAALRELNPRVYAQMGNMDYPDVGEVLARQDCNLHARGLELHDGVGFMGLGWSNRTPFGTPAEVDDGQLREWLEQAYEDVRDLQHLVLISHTPPLNTGADKIGSGEHVGSKSVREFIENVQPGICICGHIHEAVTDEYLGPTHVLNPGMLSQGGYVLLSHTENGMAAELKRI